MKKQDEIHDSKAKLLDLAKRYIKLRSGKETEIPDEELWILVEKSMSQTLMSKVLNKEEAMSFAAAAAKFIMEKEIEETNEDN
ncbi:MAG: hypothetical protein LLG04_18910 [Parachlamydia sp.]|nr:hypothetical protein [Parachlamydia sp.]